MEQIIRVYTLLVVSCLLLAGCNSEEGIGGNSTPVAVQFGSGIVQTRTTNGGNDWVTGDKVGIFVVKNGQALNSTNITEGADNRQYEVQVGGGNVSTFIPVGTDIYYPQNGDKVDFKAYYPYKAPLTNYIYPIDISDQSDMSAIDVLYSNNATNYNKNSNVVDLQFNHALSKLSFTLISGDGGPNLTNAKVEITNIATTADMSLADGAVTAMNNGQTVTATTATNGLSSSAIVIPQTLSGAKLIVTLADNVSRFEWLFTDAQFEQGKNHQYNVIISKTCITVSSSGITTWTGAGDPATPGIAQAGYKVGDYYPDPTAIYENGVLISGTPAVGVVFWLSNQNVGDHPYDKVSQHGKIVGLYERDKAYLDESWVANYGITYNAGTGWYIPTFYDGGKDYYYLYCAYNGMTYETWVTGKPTDMSKNYTKRTWFRKKITDAGGDNIGDHFYWVSSRSAEWNAYRFHFNSGNVELSGFNRTSNKTRAIKAF